jgi:MFS family permease
MVPMSSSPQSPPDPDVSSAVIEFGAEPAGRRRPGLAADRRAVPLAAALAAIAAFASLVSEWQLTTVDAATFGGGAAGDKTIPADLNDLGATGAGYLIALFPLVTALVLTMFGPAAGRRYARLAGLSVGGTLLGLLLTMAITLGDQSRIISRLYTPELGEDHLQVSYGRGLWCALFGVAAAVLALYLAGRHPAADPQTASAAQEGPSADPPAAWSWRRPRSGAEEPAPDAPFELTVSPVKPFTSLDEDRGRSDRSGRPGISG